MDKFREKYKLHNKYRQTNTSSASSVASASTTHTSGTTNHNTNKIATKTKIITKKKSAGSRVGVNVSEKAKLYSNVSNQSTSAGGKGNPSISPSISISNAASASGSGSGSGCASSSITLSTASISVSPSFESSERDRERDKDRENGNLRERDRNKDRDSNSQSIHHAAYQRLCGTGTDNNHSSKVSRRIGIGSMSTSEKDKETHQSSQHGFNAIKSRYSSNISSDKSTTRSRSCVSANSYASLDTGISSNTNIDSKKQFGSYAKIKNHSRTRSRPYHELSTSTSPEEDAESNLALDQDEDKEYPRDEMQMRSGMSISTSTSKHSRGLYVPQHHGHINTMEHGRSGSGGSTITSGNPPSMNCIRSGGSNVRARAKSYSWIKDKIVDQDADVNVNVNVNTNTNTSMNANGSGNQSHVQPRSKSYTRIQENATSRDENGSRNSSSQAQSLAKSHSRIKETVADGEEPGANVNATYSAYPSKFQEARAKLKSYASAQSRQNAAVGSARLSHGTNYRPPGSIPDACTAVTAKPMTSVASTKKPTSNPKLMQGGLQQPQSLPPVTTQRSISTTTSTSVSTSISMPPQPQISKNLSHPHDHNYYVPTEAQLRWAQFHRTKRAQQTQAKIVSLMNYPLHVQSVPGAISGDGDLFSNENEDQGQGQNDGDRSERRGGRGTLTEDGTHKFVLSRGRRALLRVSERKTLERRAFIQEHGYAMSPDDEEESSSSYSDGSESPSDSDGNDAMKDHSAIRTSDESLVFDDIAEALHIDAYVDEEDQEQTIGSQERVTDDPAASHPNQPVPYLEGEMIERRKGTLKGHSNKKKKKKIPRKARKEGMLGEASELWI